MPAGDLVVSPFQLELRATLMGRTTDVHFRDDGITGLFDDPVEPVETPWLHVDGSYVGSVRRPSRVVVAPMVVVGDTEEEVGDTVVALRTAWAADTDTSTPEQLWFQWPGFGKGYVKGQPLGLTVIDFTRSLILRRVPVVGEFLVTDPAFFT